MNVLYDHLSMFCDRKQLLLWLVSFLAIHRSYMMHGVESADQSEAEWGRSFQEKQHGT